MSLLKGTKERIKLEKKMEGGERSFIISLSQIENSTPLEFNFFLFPYESRRFSTRAKNCILASRRNERKLNLAAFTNYLFSILSLILEFFLNAKKI